MLAAGMALAGILMRPLAPSEGADAGEGLIVVLQLLIAAALWAADGYRRGRLTVHRSAAGAALLVLVLATWASLLVATELRPAMNLACEWIGMAVAFLLVRELWSGHAAARMVLLTVVALGAAEAADGIYEFGWGQQELRSAYERDPGASLRKLGIEPGSRQEFLFRQRLYAREPMGTFALANSLAGLLVLALPLGVAAVGTRWQAVNDKSRWIGMAIGLVVTLAMLGCLVLTKSRSAWLALAVLVVGVGWGARAVMGRHVRWIGVGVLGLLAAVVGAAWAIGTLDAEVLSEAPKSLRYRLQYWDGAVKVIAESPWLGVGPGSFRTHYVRYKLPEASEEVKDPHNMLLEAWASSGVVAAAALVAVFIGFAWRMARPGPADVPDPLRGSGNGRGRVPDELTERQARALGLAAGAAAFVLTGLFAPSDWTTLAGMATVWAVTYLALSAGAVADETARVWLGPGVCAGVAALGLHFLAASGLQAPGLSGTLWVTAACGLALAPARRPARLVLGQRATGLLLGALLAGTSAMSMLWAMPQYQSAPLAAEARQLLARGRTTDARRLLERAVTVDPANAEALTAQASLFWALWRDAGHPADGADFRRAVEVFERLVTVNPRRWATFQQLGLLYATHARRHADSRSWRRAVENMRRAAVLYPNNAFRCEEFARVMWWAGRHDEARRQAAEALRLHRASPHVDRKLGPAALDAMRRILEGSDPPPFRQSM